MSKPLIHIIVGARPNFIKADPVYKALEKTNSFNMKLVHTGQHYDHKMSALFFEELKMKSPDIELEVGSGHHGYQTANILSKYEQVLLGDKPNLIIVFGDVNSTIACALAAAKLNIPVAHVEAGLRSFDNTMPEEINRILTDRISNYLFITSLDAKENLINEGIKENQIHFVGNTMIDSLYKFQDYFDRSIIQKKLGINDSYALLTFHRPSNVDDEINLRKLIKNLEKVTESISCVFPLHPRTRNKLANFGLLNKLESNPRFFLSEPLGYIDFMHLQKNATLILTDSGGIQEESTCFGIPCLTIRDNTERPVTISHGTNQLIGTDYSIIPQKVEDVLNRIEKGGKDIPDLWDGKAAERIAQVLAGLDFFSHRRH